MILNETNFQRVFEGKNKKTVMRSISISVAMMLSYFVWLRWLKGYWEKFEIGEYLSSQIRFLSYKTSDFSYGFYRHFSIHNAMVTFVLVEFIFIFECIRSSRIVFE